MSDFASQINTPSAEEYLKVSESELLERLNKNPGKWDSEFPFIQSVIAVRTAETNRKTNEKLVQQTRNLVIVTWILCLVSSLAIIINIFCN